MNKKIKETKNDIKLEKIAAKNEAKIKIKSAKSQIRTSLSGGRKSVPSQNCKTVLALPWLADGVCTEECRNTGRRKNGWRLRPGRPLPWRLKSSDRGWS